MDSFLVEKGIQAVDVLKLDVQGAEYLVMKGAEDSLRSRKIRIIYTEIITQPTYVGQRLLHEVLDLFSGYGYQLFNIYNLSVTRDGALRQVDAIFVQDEMMHSGYC
jgi:hypothetical protein